MIVSDRTKLGEQGVGALVTLDNVYELVEGNIPSEKQKDILDIQQCFALDKDYPKLAVRVAKALCLMEFVRDLPRTPRNVAVLLLERVGEIAPVVAVEAVLKRLKSAQFVRETDEGWKLQTAQEKNWEQEKRGYASVKQSERNEILRRFVKEIFEASKARQYNYKGLRQFSLSLNLDGQSIQTRCKQKPPFLAFSSARSRRDADRGFLRISKNDRALHAPKRAAKHHGPGKRAFSK
jgi:hypothetical protein